MRGWLCGLAMAGVMAGVAGAQERLPQQVAGTWRIVKVLPRAGAGACWTEKEAQGLVGSVLEYTPQAMRWKGGVVPLQGVTTREVTAEDVRAEAIDPSVAGTQAPGGTQSQLPLELTDLGISGQRTLEVNLQHEDMDITGATTEVPGDSVLVAGPGRIVVSACGVYLEARRVAPRGMMTATNVAAAGPRKRI